MTETPPDPEAGAVRFTEGGTVETFDGKEWTPYRPPSDLGDRTVLRIWDFPAPDVIPGIGNWPETETGQETAQQ